MSLKRNVEIVFAHILFKMNRFTSNQY